MNSLAPRYVAAVIHYQDPVGVVDLVRSTGEWSESPALIVVADNSGEFSARKWSERLPEHAVVLAMNGNVGYGPAANEVMRYISAQRPDETALMLLTQDARLAPDAAGHLLSALGSGVAAAVPLLAFASDHERVFSAGGILYANGTTSHSLFKEPMSAVDRSLPPYDVDWGDGACTLLDLSAVEALGGFDEAYFLYVEEVDLQLRMRLSGLRVVLVPQAMAFQEPGNYSMYYKYRNLSYFTQKFPGVLKPFPWYRVCWRDAARLVLRDHAWLEPAWGVRGLLDGRNGAMGTARPRSLLRRPRGM